MATFRAAASLAPQESVEHSALPSLDLLASAVLLLDDAGVIEHANAAAEHLLGMSQRQLEGLYAPACFADGEVLERSLQEGREERFAEKGQPLALARPGSDVVHLDTMLVVLHGQPWAFLLELREIENRLRIDRADQQWQQAAAQREVLRNLAHEIKNPLGGLRGAAQLLQAELSEAELLEYTEVIIAEADRLHLLVDRILAPHRTRRQIDAVNIHEVCERVAALVLAEFPTALEIVRDYDISVPELKGDREQLIQAVLNIVRNAAEALSQMPRHFPGELTLRTRVLRQITLGGQRHALALELLIIDNGPGIPEALREHIFHPLVSGKADGTGLGLSLVQAIVQQHGGLVSVESRVGRTEFQLLLPLSPTSGEGNAE